MSRSQFLPTLMRRGLDHKRWTIIRYHLRVHWPHQLFSNTFSVSFFMNLTLLKSSVQFSSVSQSCLTFCDPMDFSMTGLPVYHQLPEFTQTHVHWVAEAIQRFHPLSSSPSPAFNLSQHQGIFPRISCSHQITKILEFQLQHQSFLWIFRTDLF